MFPKTCLSLILMCNIVIGQVVLSEIMFNPKGDETSHEYIELYNTSETNVVDMEGFMITDGQGIDQIIAVTEQLQIKPQQFALLLSPKYYQQSTAYDHIIPADALLLTIHNNQFGAYGLKNTSGEPIALMDSDSIVMSSYTYTTDNREGESDEKIILYKGDDQENWANSKQGGTPGFTNSVSPLSYDLFIKNTNSTPGKISEKDSIDLNIHLINNGLKAISEAVLQIYSLEDSLDLNGEMLYDCLHSIHLDPLDSIQINITLSPFKPGKYLLRIDAKNPKDERIHNNTVFLQIQSYPAFRPQSLLINEIYYDPSEGTSEWIELYNNSKDSINLLNWQFSDSRSLLCIQDSFYLKPDNYLLLGSSPFDKHLYNWIQCSLPALNNSGDELTLKSPLAEFIDSVKYNPSFGGKSGRSLERIYYSGSSTDPDNWAASIDSSGHTAGRYNSTSPKDYDVRLKSSFFEPETPLCNQKIHLTAVIKNIGRNDLEDITVEWSTRSFSDTNYQLIGSFSIPFLAYKDSASVHTQWSNPNPGMHQLRTEVIQAHDQLQTNNILIDTLCTSTEKHSVVITEILYQPIAPMGECIELYNNSEHPLQLCGWSLTDNIDSNDGFTFIEKVLLLPQNFCVLSRDSSTTHIHNSEVWIHASGMPSLNNNSDLLKLSDANGFTMDSVVYNRNWGGEKGRSLERIHAGLKSNDPYNWSTCFHSRGHTLGQRNSNYIPIKPRNIALSASPNPFSPNQDGIEDHTIIQYHLSRPAELLNLKIFDIQGRMVRFLLNNVKSPVNGYVTWDGTDDEGLQCRIGIYIILIEAVNKVGKTIDLKKTTLVLADRL